jgi:glycosyltransferase involved in cell wall biosynthesis
MLAIDVVIPVFNRAHTVDRAIASALAQELPGASWSIRVILVDDGSSDHLDRALARFGAAVTCIRHARNRGAAAARNTGIAAGCGDYVAFLDSDDAWLPGKVAAQLAFMERRCHRASCTAYMLKRPDKAEFVSPRYPTGTLGPSDFAWGCFVSPGSTLICRREVFARIGGFDEALQRLEDWDWLLRYAEHYPLGFLAEALAWIEVAPNAQAGKVLNALDRIQARHTAALPSRERRALAAGIEVHRAAAHYGGGRRFASCAALLKSLRFVPIGNVALAAVLYNRLPRRGPKGRRSGLTHATKALQSL